MPARCIAASTSVRPNPMRDAGLRLAIGFGRTDVEAAIHLAGIGRDHGDGGEGGEGNRDGSFADAGGAYKNWCQGPGVRYGQTDVPIPLCAAGPWTDGRGRRAPAASP